ncbi:MAG: hypothetical protein JSS49_06350 [Planctomycetes bacterium]|nr:hypothetical protein [Planctomycetota bacterium]
MRRLLTFVLVCGLTSPLWSADKPDPATLEKAFSEKLASSTLVGTFTVDGKAGTKPDRYRIVSAKKVKDADWIVTATMKVGENELDIPIPIKIYWADDTAVMSLTDLTIPGVGTFTSRVMFYGNRYAGTWQHGDHGGTFCGVIEKQPVTPEPEKK